MNYNYVFIESFVLKFSTKNTLIFHVFVLPLIIDPTLCCTCVILKFRGYIIFRADKMMTLLLEFI